MEKKNEYYTELPEIPSDCRRFDGSFPAGTIMITDQRDIEEIKRRKAAKTFCPPRDELYSVNPNFNGVYSN